MPTEPVVALLMVLGVVIARLFLSRRYWRKEVEVLSRNSDNVLAVLVEREWDITRTTEPSVWKVGGYYGESDESLGVAWEKANAVWLARKSVETPHAD